MGWFFWCIPVQQCHSHYNLPLNFRAWCSANISSLSTLLGGPERGQTGMIVYLKKKIDNHVQVDNYICCCANYKDLGRGHPKWWFSKATNDLACDFFPLASGLVPGLIQTSARAELMAAIAAVKFVARFPRPFTMWIDNDSVVQAIRRFLEPNSAPPPTKIANHDLLHELFQWMQMLRPLSQGIIKVCSHQELAKISDPIEAWAIRGNESADELASHAYLRFPKILQVRQKLLSELRSLESIKSVLHRTIINVGNLALDLIKKQRKGTHVTDIGGDNTIDSRTMREWLWPAQPNMVRPTFRMTDWSVLVEWSKSLHMPHESVKFWSWGQLVIDFGIQTKRVAPWYCRSSKRWKISTDCPRSTISQRCRWFKTYVGKILCRLTFIYLWTCRNPILMLYIFGVTVCRSLFQMLEVEWWTNGWSRDVPISSRAPTCRRFGKFRDLRRSGVFSGLKVVRAAVTLRSARKGVRKGGGLARESPPNPLNSGWRIIVICPECSKPLSRRLRLVFVVMFICV